MSKSVSQIKAEIYRTLQSTTVIHYEDVKECRANIYIALQNAINDLNKK